MIRHADTTNDGAYTAVGTYDHAELIRLVISLSQETEIPVPDLVRAFGKHLFCRFSELYPQFFSGCESSMDFLPMVESYIHVEVKKLYPDAELPTFENEYQDGVMKMTYRSKRPFADLAEGLIQACVDHFHDAISVRREDLGEQDGTNACFILTPASVSETTSAAEPCATI